MAPDGGIHSDDIGWWERVTPPSRQDNPKPKWEEDAIPCPMATPGIELLGIVGKEEGIRRVGGSN